MQTAADMPMQTYRAGEAVPKPFPEAPEMVAIPPGSFLMGSPEDEPERLGCEGAQHEVHIGRWLAVGKYAVTFKEWDRFADETGYGSEKVAKDFNWGRGTHPVINVSWDDAQAYAKWLNAKAGLGETSPNRYRLLSEAEWEYACRAGSTSAFSWGDSLNADQANYDGNSSYNGSPQGEWRQKTVPVDSFQPNAFGIYQMHGNVWEWVEDGWHDDNVGELVKGGWNWQANYAGAPTDGSVWTSGADTSRRVLRGGAWNDAPHWLRSASRLISLPQFGDDCVGFRLARTLP